MYNDTKEDDDTSTDDDTMEDGLLGVVQSSSTKGVGQVE